MLQLQDPLSRAIDRNNFSNEYAGEYYANSIEDSPYTKDMKEIDKGYLKIFLETCKRCSERYCRFKIWHDL